MKTSAIIGCKAMTLVVERRTRRVQGVLLMGSTSAPFLSLSPLPLPFPPFLLLLFLLCLAPSCGGAPVTTGGGGGPRAAGRSLAEASAAPAAPPPPSPPSPPSFKIEHDSFMKDGVPFQILGGEFHYFRTPPALWADRLRRLKAMVSPYLRSFVCCFTARVMKGSLSRVLLTGR